MASSKKDLDKPATQGQILEIMEMIKEFGTMLLEKFDGLRGEFDGLRGEFGESRIEFESFRDEQRQFNKEITQKVDENTSAIKALDKRVRYQDDMPGRLDHVENKQYELERRVNVLEKSK